MVEYMQYIQIISKYKLCINYNYSESLVQCNLGANCFQKPFRKFSAV